MLKEEIEALYIDFVHTHNKLPSYLDLERLGVSRSKVRTGYGNLTLLHETLRRELPEDIVFTVGSVFDGSRSVDNTTTKRYIITTAVADSPAHKGFIEAMKTYAEHNQAQIVIMPAESKTNSFANNTATFDPIFSQPGFLFVTQDTPLNNNLHLCSIQVSANQVRPITGLSRLGAREGSYVFASPKQFLEFIPSSNRGKNYSIMTPGACTLPAYMNTNTFVSKRLAYIAEHDHTIGAIVVDIEDDRYFHFRQVQASVDGSFIDFGILYTPEGEVVPGQEMTLVLGDIHAASIDEEVLSTFVEEVAEFNINSIIIHDLFDGVSVSHHIKTPGEKARRDLYRIDYEVIFTLGILDKIKSIRHTGDVVVVKSNHDEFLDRYIDEGRYIDDPSNYRIALDLAIQKHDSDGDLLEYVLNRFGVSDTEGVTFLNRESSYIYAGIELGAHGDLGVNGTKATLNSLEKVYGSCVTAHAHTAAIQRSVFRVGTFSELDMGYNRGPSSWTHTFCIVNHDGSRQLVNFINGWWGHRSDD